MNTNIALKFLRSKEWTMGNGQCHECCGNKPRKGWWTDTVGHAPTCKLAKAIESLGGKIVWERENHSKARRESARFWKMIIRKAAEDQARSEP